MHPERTPADADLARHRFHDGRCSSSGDGAERGARPRRRQDPPGDFAVGWIAGAVNLPVEQVEQHRAELVSQIDRRDVVMICQAGSRALRAAELMTAVGAENVSVLDGGMNAWTAADGPTETRTSRTWALERQVRLVAGGIVATSILGSVWGPKLRFVAGGIGAGLVFAAVSNTCAMGTVLSKLPLNRAGTVDVRAALDAIPD